MKDAKATNLKEIISNSKLMIPRYQRSYSWGRSQVNDLLDDIEYIRSSEESKEHYFGTIVLNKSGEYQWTATESIPQYDIVDGQQRLTTISIVLRCFVSELEKIEDSDIDTSEYDLPDAIEGTTKKFICKNKRNETQKRLELGKLSESVYNSLVVENKSPDKIDTGRSITLPGRKIVEAENTVRERLDSWRGEMIGGRIDEASEQEVDAYTNQILESIATVTNDFRVTQNIVSDFDESARMFKVINDRGKDLTLFDKINSHLTYYASQSDEVDSIEISKKLNSAVEAITMFEDAGDAHINEFMTAHWTIFTGEYRTRTSDYKNDSIYNRIKMPRHAAIRENNDAWVREYIASLETFASHYIELKKPSLLVERYGKGSIKYLSDRLNTIRASGSLTIYMPLLMTAKQAYNTTSEDFYRIVSLLESFTFRYNHVLKNGNGLMADSGKCAHALHWRDTSEKELREIFYGDYSYKTYSSESEGINEIVKTLKDRIKERCDDKILTEFLSKSDVIDGNGIDNWTGLRSKTTLKLIFYEYEKNLRDGSDTALDQLPTFEQWDSEYEIEHIHPQNPKNRNSSQDELLNNIGNLAVIGTGDNKNASNRSFENKKKTYRNSHLDCLIQISKKDSWNKEEIENRQKEIVKFCKERWSADWPDKHVYPTN
jgi:hypothetical protein